MLKRYVELRTRIEDYLLSDEPSDEGYYDLLLSFGRNEGGVEDLSFKRTLNNCFF